MSDEKLSTIKVLKLFFDNPPPDLNELKKLSPEERLELAKEAAEILGVELAITKEPKS